jgi:hypothetical protein
MHGCVFIPRPSLATPYNLRTIGLFLILRQRMLGITGIRFTEAMGLEEALQEKPLKSTAIDCHKCIDDAWLAAHGLSRREWTEAFKKELGSRADAPAISVCAIGCKAEDPMDVR